MKLIKYALLAVGVLLLAYTAVLAVIANFNAGVIITAAVSVVLILYGAFFDRLRTIKWLARVFVIGLGALACLTAFIAIYGRADNVTYTEDAVIVLGAGIRGEQVTLPLAYRLDKAVEYSKKNPDAVIVVSGGQGFQEDIPEALAMERYLISKGVGEERIVREENSTSTYTNFTYSKEILDQLFDGDYKTAFITNNFHIYRATLTAKAAGLDSTHYHAKIQWYLIPVSYLRECAAVMKTWADSVCTQFAHAIRGNQ